MGSCLSKLLDNTCQQVRTYPLTLFLLNLAATALAAIELTWICPGICLDANFANPFIQPQLQVNSYNAVGEVTEATFLNTKDNIFIGFIKVLLICLQKTLVSQHNNTGLGEAGLLGLLFHAATVD
jgi:hypothetical protein